MKITEKKITVAELTNSFIDNSDDGVFAYGGLLVCRPPYQREFVYSPEQQVAVIDTVMKGYPLNIMYWSKDKDGKYEINFNS